MIKFFKALWSKITKTKSDTEPDTQHDPDLEPFNMMDFITTRIAEIWPGDDNVIVSEDLCMYDRYEIEITHRECKVFRERMEMQRYRTVGAFKRDAWCLTERIDSFIKKCKVKCETLTMIIQRYPYLENSNIAIIDVATQRFVFNPTIMEIIRYLKSIAELPHYIEYRAYVINQLADIATNPRLRNLDCHVGNIACYEQFEETLKSQFNLGVSFEEVSELISDVQQNMLSTEQIALFNMIANAQQAQNQAARLLEPTSDEGV